jgi:hypothetical protein
LLLLANNSKVNVTDKGRAMAQAVSRRPLTAECRVNPCGICGGQSGTGTGISPSTLIFPCQFHFTGTPLHGKPKKTIIFITGLHNKPQGCGASVASAAGSFTKKKKCDCCKNKKVSQNVANVMKRFQGLHLISQHYYKMRVSNCIFFPICSFSFLSLLSA